MAIGVLLAVRLCHEWFGPDIWYHLALGERIGRSLVAQPADNLILQQPGFVNVYWLFQLVARGAFGVAGIHGVSALFIAVWFAAVTFWLRTTGAVRAMPWGGWLTLGAVFVCQTRFEERPEVFSYLFLAIQIHWLTTWKFDGAAAPRSLIAFTVVQVLWSNSHGYFALGPLLVGAKLVSVALGTPRTEWARLRPAWRGLGWLAGLTLAATVVSPFGPRNWSGVATLWKFFDDMRLEVHEFLPATGPFLALWTVKIFWLGWAATLVTAVGLLVTAPRREAFALLLAAAGLWLSATSFRNIPLLVFLAAPLAGSALQRAANFRPFEKLSSLMVGGAALTLAGFAIVPAAGGSSFGIRASASASPIQFTDYLRAANFGGRLFNPPADGGYLAFRLPALGLYGDSRYVEAGPIREYFSALREPAAFRQLDQRVQFDAALFKLAESRAVVRSLVHDPAWSLVYADLHRAFLVKRASPAAAAFRGEQLEIYRSEDLAERVNADAALQWIALFAEANNAAGLQHVLGSLGTAPRLPAVVLEAALRYAIATGDQTIFKSARSLRPKMLVSQPADAAVVDGLLAQGLGR